MNKAIIFFIISVPCYANTTDFNLSFVHGLHTITPQFYSNNNTYVPGNYLVKVYVNGKYTKEKRLIIDESDKSTIYFTKQWLNNAGVFINTQFYSHCYNIKNKKYNLSLNKDTKIRLDYQTQNLYFQIPQQGLKIKDNQEKWDEGNTALSLNYYLSVNKYINQHTNISASTNFSLNYQAWRLKGNATTNNSKVNIPNIEFKRDIQDIKSDISFGRENTSTQFYPSFSFTGAEVYSNDSMTPWQLRGYAPAISGSVTKNSTIIISQNNFIIKKLSLSPGPYFINDINTISNADLIVKIISSDGNVEIKHYSVNQLSTLLRPNTNKYYFSVGKKRDNRSNNFLELEESHGTNLATITFGGIVDKDYKNILIGITTSLGEFGAISAINKYSFSHYKYKNFNGNQFIINYNNNLNDRNFLQFKFEKNSNENYIDYDQFSPDAYFNNNYNFKKKYSLTYNISIPRINTSIQSNLWYSSNFNNKYQHGINFYFNTGFKDFYITTSLMMTKDSNSHNDNYTCSLSLNVPLSNSTYASSSINIDKNNQLYSMGINKEVNNRFNYSIYSNYSNENQVNASLSSSYTFDATQLNTTIAHNNYNTSGNIQLSGSIFGVHNNNNYLIFNHNTASTVAIVDIPNIPNIKFNGSIPTNNNGLTLVPLNAYENNLLTINTNKLPSDISLINSSYNIIPTDDAIILKSFNYSRIYTYILQVYNKSKSIMPFGSIAYDEKHNTVGFIQNNGILIIRSNKKQPRIFINTGNNSCNISTAMLKVNDNSVQEAYCD